MNIGVLSVQGDFALHQRMFESLGYSVQQIRKPHQLNALDRLVIPGGESTTFHIMLNESGLWDALITKIREGIPTWGTCAGAIMLGYGDEPPQPRMNLIDMSVIRNGYGRQVDSFIHSIDITGFTDKFPAVFIRAPLFNRIGNGVEILSALDDKPIMVRSGNILASSFHPELTSDTRVHRYFAEM